MPTPTPVLPRRRGRSATAAVRRAVPAGLAVLTLLALLVGGAAPSGAVAPTAATVEVAPPTTADAARRFLDEELPRYVERFAVPGVTASIVVPGGGVVVGAAGTADAATGRAMTPDTAVRVASISKSFTAVAVLQLLDAGAFALDTPVEELLPRDVVLDRRDGWRAVTVEDLLTHTAGFEDRLAGTTTAPGASTPDLHRYLRQAHVRRIDPPGAVVSYSNYGYALLGLVVQTMSATPFTHRLDDSVFGPIGMSRTTFASPDDVAGLAVAHLRGDGPEPAPVTGMAEFPAGGATSTAGDMGRFMGWLLAADHAPVLSEASARGVVERHAGVHPELPGSGWGTWERLVPGVRTPVVGHDGDLAGAHSTYVVLPREEVGLFVSVDGDPVDAVHDLRRAFVTDFVQRVTSSGPTAGPAAASRPGPVVDVAGTYLTSRRSVSDASAAKVALDQVRVTMTTGGGLRTENPALGTTDWEPSGRDVFVSADGERLALLRDRQGRVRGLGTSVVPTQTYQRVSTLHDPFLHLAVAVGGGLVGLVGASIVGIARLRERRRSPVRVGRAGRAADTSLVLAAVSVAVAAVCLVAGAAAPAGVENVIAGRSPLLSWPFTVATVVSAVAVLASAVRPGVSWGRRARDVLSALGSLSACAVAVGYHLTLF